MDVHVLVNRMARSPKRYSLNRKANEKHRSFSPSNKSKLAAVRFSRDQPHTREHHSTTSSPVMIYSVQDARNMSPNFTTFNDSQAGDQLNPQPMTRMPMGSNAIPVAAPSSPAVYGNTTSYNARYNDALIMGQNDFLALRMSKAQSTRNQNVHGTMDGNQTPIHNFFVKNGARIFSVPIQGQDHFSPYVVSNTPPQFHPANRQSHYPRQQLYYHGNQYPGNARQFFAPQHAAYNPYMESPWTN